MKSSIGQIVKSERKAIHMSLREMSNSTGIPYSNILLWERGKGNIGVEDFTKIAKALGYSGSELLKAIEVTL